MKTKSKPKKDYVVEVNLPGDKLVDTVIGMLKKKYGLETEKVADSTNEFLSEDRRHSFRKAVIETIPAQVVWCVEKLSPTQCQLAVFFPFPPWLRKRFYLVFLALGCLFSVVVLPVGLGLTGGTPSLSPITLASLFVGMGTIIVFIIVLFLYLGLLGRYVLFWQNFLQSLSKSCRNGFMPVLCKLVPVKSRFLLIDWKMFVFALCTFFGVPLVLFNEDLLRAAGAAVTSELGLILLGYGMVIIPFYVLAWRIQNKHSLIEKVGATTPDFCLVCFIGLLLTGVPIIMHVFAKLATHLVNVAATGDSASVLHQMVVPSSPDITSPVLVLADLRLLCIGMGLMQVLFGVSAFALLIISSREFAYYWSNPSMVYPKYLQEIFHSELRKAGGTDRMSLRLPVILKISTVLVFLALSLACWAGVFLNLSLVNSLAAPDFRLIPISHGETIVRGTTLMAGGMLGRLGEDGSVHTLRLLFVAPAVIPFSVFAFLTFRALVRSHLRARRYVPAKGGVVARVNEIAARIGVSEVYCLLDSWSSRTSPYAVVRGWRPRNMIVFSEHSLAFLAEHPKHAQAILAHEVAHLKHDCLTLWILRFLSRLSLVGVSFLGLLLDSIAMEDRADGVARRYLREIGRDENLLTEAAFLIEAQDYLYSESHDPDQQTNVTFFLTQNRPRTGSSQTEKSFIRRIAAALRMAHDLYFHTELYDYIHREAKYRRTQPNLERMAGR